MRKNWPGPPPKTRPSLTPSPAGSVGLITINKVRVRVSVRVRVGVRDMDSVWFSGRITVKS